MSFAGFDTSGYPGAATMAWLRKNTNLVWTGFYLKSPSHRDAGWMTHRAELVAQGWGLAPIYVGQQVTGPGSHHVTAAQGTKDGADAAAMMRQAGFGRSYVFLDLENGPPFSLVQAEYVGAWVDAVQAARFEPGVYCSYQMAAVVHGLRPQARLWVFHVPSTAPHRVSGAFFPTLDPGKSGYSGAYMWQREMQCQITIPGGTLLVDLDTAVSADPGASSGAAAAPPVVATAPAAVLPVLKLGSTGDDVKRLQREIGGLAVDGDFGRLTEKVVRAFQGIHGLVVDGIVGPKTWAALALAQASV